MHDYCCCCRGCCCCRCRCVAAGDPPNGTVRLVKPLDYQPIAAAPDSHQATQGYVQVFMNGQWGAICAEAWGDAEAHVACRQANPSRYVTGRAVNIPPSSVWRGAFALSRVDCPVPTLASSNATTGGAWLLSCPATAFPSSPSGRSAQYCPVTEMAAARCYTAAEAASAPPLEDPAPAAPQPAWAAGSSCQFCIEIDQGAASPRPPRTHHLLSPAVCNRFANTLQGAGGSSGGGGLQRLLSMAAKAGLSSASMAALSSSIAPFVCESFDPLSMRIKACALLQSTVRGDQLSSALTVILDDLAYAESNRREALEFGASLMADAGLMGPLSNTPHLFEDVGKDASDYCS